MTDILARFTPVGPDPADLMFQMGRTSAPTPRRWKLAVAGLLLSNAAFAWVALRPTPPVTLVVPVVVPVVVSPADPEEPPRYGPLRAIGDPDDWPPVEAFAGVAPTGPPLTPLAARRGDID